MVRVRTDGSGRRFFDGERARGDEIRCESLEEVVEEVEEDGKRSANRNRESRRRGTNGARSELCG